MSTRYLRFSKVWLTFFQCEINQFEALACLQGEHVEWVKIPGLFDLGKLRGATPIV